MDRREAAAHAVALSAPNYEDAAVSDQELRAGAIPGAETASIDLKFVHRCTERNRWRAATLNRCCEPSSSSCSSSGSWASSCGHSALIHVLLIAALVIVIYRLMTGKPVW